MKTKVSIWWLIGVAVVFIVLIKQCEGETNTVTETVVKWKTDSVYVDKIQKVKEPVYIEKTKTIKGKDSIIYVDRKTDSTITANEYKTTLNSNEAKADLSIISTGEVLDVKGTITYPEKETTITNTRDASGLFLYGATPINKTLTPEIGLLYQFKNNVFISGSAQYNNLTNGIDAKVGVGIKIW